MQLQLDVLDAVRSVMGRSGAHLHAPFTDFEDREMVSQAVREGNVSAVGSYVSEFESQLSSLLGGSAVVATSAGTHALHLALITSGVQAGDEVIIPALSFVAPAAATSQMGAIPHFVDVEDETFGMNPESLRQHLLAVSTTREGRTFNRMTGRRLSAIIAVHIFGHPCRITELSTVAGEFGLTLIEDNAEGLGSTYKNQPLGTFGHISVLSFNGNKIVTTGGGGAIVSRDHELVDRARHLGSTAKLPTPFRFKHDEVGFNYRMPNLNAALGCSQLKKLSKFVDRKRNLFRQYKSAFASVKGVRIMSDPSSAKSNFWLQAMVLDPHFRDQRDSILEVLNGAAFQSRAAWDLLTEQKPYETSPRADIRCAQDLQPRIINLPSGVDAI